ncbi:low-specificity L-threonine aldolase [Thorsellia kenyensis]|uniref:Low-specificity L-threonine aldolase n=1 Tax=Thorsellia kenyensis TaxID=1549888 RepID=A0ABV6CDA9_9GAMM
MIIDLRSDTVTRPCNDMRQAMANAVVGDDVYSDDPSVNQLQETLCKLTQKEAALFMPSGTQSNLVAILSHCQRGEAFIVGSDAHIFKYEGGGSAVLGSTLPTALPQSANGQIEFELIKKSIKPKDIHFAPMALLCFENTFNGRVVDLTYQQDVCHWAKSTHGLKTHLDGARIFNASIETGIAIHDLVSCYDSVSICLSKGLGAPVGSVLCGSKDFIARARSWRKMLGGGLRQSGVLASAGLYALDHNVERLKEDHLHAELLAKLLMEKGFHLEGNQAHTNMLFIDDTEEKLQKLHQLMEKNGILIGYYGSGTQLRLVLHKDINEVKFQHIMKVISGY